MGVDNGFAAVAGCFMCVALAVALISVQNQAREPLDASWKQLLALIAPVHRTVLDRMAKGLGGESGHWFVEVAETMARLQLNMNTLSRILDTSDQWVPSSALRDVLRLRQQRLLFHCSVVLLRVTLIWFSTATATDKILLLTMQTYSRFVDGLIALHQAHHAGRVEDLARACGRAGRER